MSGITNKINTKNYLMRFMKRSFIPEYVIKIWYVIKIFDIRPRESASNARQSTSFNALTSYISFLKMFSHKHKLIQSLTPYETQISSALETPYEVGNGKISVQAVLLCASLSKTRLLVILLCLLVCL